MARLSTLVTEPQRQLDRLHVLEVFRGYRVRAAEAAQHGRAYSDSEHTEPSGWSWAVIEHANREIAALRAALRLPRDPEPAEIPAGIDVDAEIANRHAYIEGVRQRFRRPGGQEMSDTDGRMGT
jgi:hypothetical protein